MSAFTPEHYKELSITLLLGVAECFVVGSLSRHDSVQNVDTHWTWAMLPDFASFPPLFSGLYKLPNNSQKTTLTRNTIIQSGLYLWKSISGAFYYLKETYEGEIDWKRGVFELFKKFYVTKLDILLLYNGSSLKFGITGGTFLEENLTKLNKGLQQWVYIPIPQQVLR